ncbi:putative reverse transcriptase domain-containing protein [Tanacetum coccineum]
MHWQALLRKLHHREWKPQFHTRKPTGMQTARPCFYADFMKCQPLNFKGTEGVVGLTRWIEKMESVFNISGCAIENQVKFATCTLLGVALTWWNAEKVDKYISGLPDNIYRNVKSARPKTLDETIELANDLMDQKLRTYAERQSDNKRKADDSSRNNHGHQQQPPRGRMSPRSTGNTNVANTQKGNRAAPKGNGCFKCGAPGHFKRDCPKLKNKDGGNGNAQGWLYAVGNAEKRGNASGNRDSNVVTAISCSKAQEYMAKGCQVFLAQISAKKEEDKSEGKQLKDVPTVRDFPKVFPEDLPGL